MTTVKTSIKRSTKSEERDFDNPPIAPLTMKEVLRVIKTADALDPSHTVWDCVLREYRVRGGKPDTWNTVHIGRMAEAIIRCEDHLELMSDCSGRRESRIKLRDIRRNLECLVWR